MISIDQIRYSQQRLQNLALRSLSQAPIATYKNRDATTGQRRLELADGSIAYANYLSDSEPGAVPQYLPGANIGTPGFISNR
jgi:hypothetical protein